jgi:hypothetical protein
MSRKAPAREPMTIPAIAPPLSPPPLPTMGGTGPSVPTAGMNGTVADAVTVTPRVLVGLKGAVGAGPAVSIGDPPASTHTPDEHA